MSVKVNVCLTVKQIIAWTGTKVGFIDPTVLNEKAVA